MRPKNRINWKRLSDLERQRRIRFGKNPENQERLDRLVNNSLYPVVARRIFGSAKYLEYYRSRSTRNLEELRVDPKKSLDSYLVDTASKMVATKRKKIGCGPMEAAVLVERDIAQARKRLTDADPQIRLRAFKNFGRFGEANHLWGNFRLFTDTFLELSQRGIQKWKLANAPKTKKD